MMVNYFQMRLTKVQNSLADFEAYYFSNNYDIYYLTGFTGDDSFLMVTKTQAVFITDGRYTEQIRQEAKIPLRVEMTSFERKQLQIVQSILMEEKIKTLLTAKKDMNIEYYENLTEKMKNESFSIKDSQFIKQIRMVKDEYEIEILRQNLLITQLGYNYIIRMIEEGRKENEIAAELEYFLRKNGAVRTSFDTIIASGERTVLPHGTATDKLIKKDEIIMMDFGIFKNGYCSDFTRCYNFGKIIGAKIREIHSVVFDALKNAQSIIKPGILASAVHKEAYETIKKAGYEKNFWHSTGHGVGIEVHEQPSISFAGDTVLKEGMVFTVEPGIYLPGTGGIRLEDMVIVRKNGCEVLTSASYDL